MTSAVTENEALEPKSIFKVTEKHCWERKRKKRFLYVLSTHNSGGASALRVLHTVTHSCRHILSNLHSWHYSGQEARVTFCTSIPIQWHHLNRHCDMLDSLMLIYFFIFSFSWYSEGHRLRLHSLLSFFYWANSVSHHKKRHRLGFSMVQHLYK